MSILDIGPALRGFLLADASISAAVGGVRIHAEEDNQGNIVEALLYSTVDEQSDQHMQGPTGLSVRRIQTKAKSATRLGSVTLSNLVLERLHGYRGVMATAVAPAVSIDVQLARHVFTRTYREGSPVAFYFVQLDFELTYWRLA